MGRGARGRRTNYGLAAAMGRKTGGGTVLFDTVRTASTFTDGVLVGISCGKDSVVTLDLCARFFKRVVGFFMYLVKGLSFQEATLRYYEKRYGIEILRIPHFAVSEYLRYGMYSPPDHSVPIVSTLDTYNYVREQTGIYWIACGERISDSIVRTAMIKHSGSIDDTRGRIYPVAYWTTTQIKDYIAKRRLKLSPETKLFGRSWVGPLPRDMYLLKHYYPEEFEKIVEWYPDSIMALKQFELYHKDEVNEDGSLKPKKRRTVA